MYLQHWKLNELPFENTPNPKFFYSSEAHEEALSRLEYLVSERKACGVLTGVYGCGKTFVLHALIKAVTPQGGRFSVVTNPNLDAAGILRMVLYGFKKTSVPADKTQVLIELQETFTKVADDGKHSIVIIDEAHAIEDQKVFEELRLLLNFQTEDRFLVTLLLVGQPELKALVDANKQLNQRVNLRYHLGPFSVEETGRYVHHRMKIAGCADPGAVFPPSAVEVIHKQSGGIPRWINQVAHMSLLVGFSKSVQSLAPEMIQEAAQDLGGFT